MAHDQKIPRVVCTFTGKSHGQAYRLVEVSSDNFLMEQIEGYDAMGNARWASWNWGDMDPPAKAIMQALVDALRPHE